MVFEALVVKGLVAIGHYAAAHMTAGAAAAVVHAAAGMTLAQIASATVTAGFVTGCVVWTGERIKNVQKGVKAIEMVTRLQPLKNLDYLPCLLTSISRCFLIVLRRVLRKWEWEKTVAERPLLGWKITN